MRMAETKGKKKREWEGLVDMKGLAAPRVRRHDTARDISTSARVLRTTTV